MFTFSNSFKRSFESRRSDIRWIAILSAFLLTACSMIAGNSPQSETQESINQKIAKGKTTKAEVKAKFGEPVSTTPKERGTEEWSYKMSGSGNAVKIPGLERFFGTEKIRIGSSF